MKTAASGTILTISKSPRLAELVKKTAGDSIKVDYAAGETEGTAISRKTRFEIIIIGEMETPETAFRLYRNLREGWISRHASLLIIDAYGDGNTCRILGDGHLTMKIGGHAFREGDVAPVFPEAELESRLRETVGELLRAPKNFFKDSMLDKEKFCLVWEQIPGPGAYETRQETVLENSRKAARSDKVCAISITDNPGGNPAIATDILCAEIRKAGIDPLVHVAFRDRSRNQVESLLFQLAALDIQNVLILTGDYPSNLGFKGKSKPVFDLDSVNGLRLVAGMNRGMEREIMRKPVRLAPTAFFAGVAVSPFKQMEAEVMGQYYKMRKKIAAGADFAITQVGYDARKMHELLMWLKAHSYDIPALAGIYVLSHPVAKAMHRNNIPGCVVTGKLLDRIASEAEHADKGRQARLDRAAKMYAIARGMGYKGAYISGQGLPFESVEYIISRGNELAANWMDLLPEFDYPQENGFYFFERDAKTGLNTAVPALRRQQPQRPPMFLISQIVHAAAFEPESPLFRPIRKLMRRIDASRFRQEILHFLERCGKNALYACKDCGDCALFDAAYLCPVSQCPKDQRNAPCGGSHEGWCEVYPGQIQCVWVRAYLRLKSRGKESEIGEIIIPPCDWALWQTSAWVNYYLGRDHSNRQVRR
ncbi:MAG TPA: methylenetetrahydrofolate reductase C-terminal domain-containing protein [Acidobacteriota bacterium]|nr:methylenetetrahydrofolate reductase C-terminal domain-containing protein [Acidobacteriota bacterium]